MEFAESDFLDENVDTNIGDIEDPAIREKTISILKGQLAGSSMYIVVLILSIVLLYNQILTIEGEEEFLETSTTANINILNRIVVFLLVLYFLYTSYENIKMAEAQEKDTTYLRLQFIASLLTVISAIIVLYVAFEQYNKVFVPIASTENPNL